MSKSLFQVKQQTLFLGTDQLHSQCLFIEKWAGPADSKV